MYGYVSLILLFSFGAFYIYTCTCVCTRCLYNNMNLHTCTFSPPPPPQYEVVVFDPKSAELGRYIPERDAVSYTHVYTCTMCVSYILHPSTCTYNVTCDISICCICTVFCANIEVGHINIARAHFSRVFRIFEV